MNYMPYLSKTKSFPYNQFSEKFSSSSITNNTKAKKEGEEILQNDKLSPSSTTKNNEINFPVNHHILSSNNIGLYLDFPMKKNNSVSKLKNSNSKYFHEFAKSVPKIRLGNFEINFYKNESVNF